jgi:hypothetical protein
MGRSLTAIEASAPRLIETAVLGGFEGFYPWLVHKVAAYQVYGAV